MHMWTKWMLPYREIFFKNKPLWQIVFSSKTAAMTFLVSHVFLYPCYNPHKGQSLGTFPLGEGRSLWPHWLINHGQYNGIWPLKLCYKGGTVSTCPSLWEHSSLEANHHPVRKLRPHGKITCKFSGRHSH